MVEAASGGREAECLEGTVQNRRYAWVGERGCRFEVLPALQVLGSSPRSLSWGDAFRGAAGPLLTCFQVALGSPRVMTPRSNYLHSF